MKEKMFNKLLTLHNPRVDTFRVQASAGYTKTQMSTLCNNSKQGKKVRKGQQLRAVHALNTRNMNVGQNT